MRVMVIVKATKNSEAGKMPSEKLLGDMGKFNEELVKAGIMLAGDGLKPSSKGKRIRITDTVLDPKARVLKYGTTTKFGSLRCTSRTTGITCRSTRSSHGFVVSMQRQRVF